MRFYYSFSNVLWWQDFDDALIVANRKAERLAYPFTCWRSLSYLRLIAIRVSPLARIISHLLSILISRATRDERNIKNTNDAYGKLIIILLILWAAHFHILHTFHLRIIIIKTIVIALANMPHTISYSPFSFKFQYIALVPLSSVSSWANAQAGATILKPHCTHN